jgi:hypothetical protein
MTAPRNCRACGTPLPPSVRWCHLCYTKVVELTPRAKGAQGYVGQPRPDVHYSRWRGNALTFGPAGRLVITGCVVLFGVSFVVQGFNPAMIWPLGMYMVAATIILKEVWKPVRIDAPAEPRPHDRPSALRRPVSPRPVVAVVAGLALVVAFLGLRHQSELNLFLPGCALVMVGFGYLISRLFDL